MKLIFKIYKKVRDLKKEERELLHRINSLVVDKTMLDSDIKKLHYERLHENEHIHWRDASQNERQTQLDEREKKLNKLQEKINDQILKLGIVNGFNK